MVFTTLELRVGYWNGLEKSWKKNFISVLPSHVQRKGL